MKAVEKLEAAIAKLKGLRDTSSGGTWKLRRLSLTGGSIEIDPARQIVEPWSVDLEDAELIVTLHGTIDAQLGILRTAANYFVEDPLRPRAVYSWVSDAIRLAEAIVGEATE